MSMQAAVFHGDKNISITTQSMPEVVPGEVLLRVKRTALCGSDTKLWHKGASWTPGHEIFGVVQQSGHALDGQRCCVYIPVHCGHCAACEQGDTHMCLTISELVGWNRPGGYAEYLAVPELCLLPVPDDIDDDLAPLLLDTIGTSAHAIRFVQGLVPPARSGPVLVTGAGPVGLGAVLALRHLGYTDIWISDLKPERLALGQSFGAQVHPVGSTQKHYQLILECSGSHAARNMGMNIVGPRGVLVLVGENDAPWTITETKTTRRKDFHMVRSFYFPKSDFALNLELLRHNAPDYRRLVDSCFGITELPGKYAQFAAGDLIKPLLAFN